MPILIKNQSNMNELMIFTSAFIGINLFTVGYLDGGALDGAVMTFWVLLFYYTFFAIPAQIEEKEKLEEAWNRGLENEEDKKPEVKMAFDAEGEFSENQDCVV